MNNNHSPVPQYILLIAPAFSGRHFHVEGSNTPGVGIEANLLEVFKTPAIVNLANDSYIMSAGVKANITANNYTDMFRVIYRTD